MNLTVSELLSRPGRNSPHITIHFRRRTSENQTTDSSSRYLNVLKRSKKMNLLVGQHNPCFCYIFNRVLCLSSLPRNATYCTRQMITLEYFHIIYLEAFNVEVVQSK